jgi:hypothetical protein
MIVLIFLFYYEKIIKNNFNIFTQKVQKVDNRDNQDNHTSNCIRFDDEKLSSSARHADKQCEKM